MSNNDSTTISLLVLLQGVGLNCPTFDALLGIYVKLANNTVAGNLFELKIVMTCIGMSLITHAKVLFLVDHLCFLC